MAERTAVLDRHIPPFEGSPIPEAQLGYNIRFDRQDYQTLASQRPYLSPQEFQRRSDQLDLRTTHNLQTMLGERFTVEISKVEYHLISGQLQNPDHDEPFLEIIKRGQKFRQEHGSKEIPREAAEAEGFAKVQEILNTRYTEPCDPKGPNQIPDIKVIVVSPRGPKGSIYQHNFYDVYSRSYDGAITMSRYTSKLSYEEFYQSARSIDPLLNLSQNPTDAEFLANPLITYQSLDQIQKIFCPQEKVMTQKEYQMLLETCGFLFTTYINCLINGSPLAEIQKVYNTLLNFADVWPNTVPMQNTDQIISHYGILPVRVVAAGCGIQSGSDSQNYSSWSVAEFGKWFTCPKCNYEATGPVGNTCPGCGLTKEEFAKESLVCA